MTAISRRARGAALVAALALGVLAPISEAAAAEPAFVSLGVAATVPSGARPLGALPPSRSFHLGVSLAVRDSAGLHALATAIATPGSADHGHDLGPGAFASHFGATTASIALVSQSMRRAGLKVGRVSANHLIIPVSGSVGAVERAFRTRIEGYRLPNGTAGWAASSAPEIPAALAGTVNSVIGLDNLLQSETDASPTSSARSARAAGARQVTATAIPGGPDACAAARRDAAAAGAWTDSEIADAYGINNLYAKGDLAQGQTIALFELEPFRRTDLATFDRCYFGVSHANLVSSVHVDGYALAGAGSGEAVLDVENLSALAPLAHILVYDAPNTTYGAIDAYNEIVSQDLANIVTTSWGECESALETSAPGAQQLENTLFEEAATQGQTVFAATGDTGSDDCASTPFGSNTAVHPLLSVDDPASQPFVVSVGGTSLASDALPRPSSAAESVWNDGPNGGGGGGGLSQSWSAPAWQVNPSVPGLHSASAREVPDVSASADEERGITVYSSAGGPQIGAGAVSSTAGWSTIGGTSSATPMWAAITAEIAASGGAGTSCGALPDRAGGADLGFIAPSLYAVASTTSGYNSAFVDVTVGDNDIFRVSSGSYAASPGYDLASGLGAPLVTAPSGSGGLAAALCAEATGSPLSGATEPVISSLTPSSGPTSGGTAVTVSLANSLPSGSTVTATVGGARATVTSQSASSVTLVTPTSPLTPDAPAFDTAGPAEVVLTASEPSGSASSLVAPASVFQYVGSSASGTVVPVISGVGPSGGSVAGRNRVTVYGSDFTPGARVTFGGVASASVRFVGVHELAVVVPPRRAATHCTRGARFHISTDCQVEVVVSEATGSSPTSKILPALAGRIVFSPEGVVLARAGTEVAPATTEYDYAPRPRITSIQPNPTDIRGNRPVTIYGSGFNLNTFDWVNFGSPRNSASEQVAISVIEPGRIVIAPPAGPPGALPGGVSVQSVVGLSNVVAFSYGPVPSVTSTTTPRSTGGAAVVLLGSDLGATEAVRFVSEAHPGHSLFAPVGAVVSRDATRLVVDAPLDLVGPYHVEPCSAAGCAAPSTVHDTVVFRRAT